MSAASLFSPVFLRYTGYLHASVPQISHHFFCVAAIIGRKGGNVEVKPVLCPAYHNSHSRFASRHLIISAYSSGVNATPSSSVSSNAITLAIAFSSFELYSYNSVNHITFTHATSSDNDTAFARYCLMAYTTSAADTFRVLHWQRCTNPSPNTLFSCCKEIAKRLYFFKQFSSLFFNLVISSRLSQKHRFLRLFKKVRHKIKTCAVSHNQTPCLYRASNHQMIFRIEFRHSPSSAKIPSIC